MIALIIPTQPHTQLQAINDENNLAPLCFMPKVKSTQRQVMTTEIPPLPSFSPPSSQKSALEEGTDFTPRFDEHGLIVCITREENTGTILMVAYMNAESLALSLSTGIAHYWSRSRAQLWRKGDTSGQVQRIVDLYTDCDQDALLLSVRVEGDGKACHTGRKSCFYRRVSVKGERYQLAITEE
jgi:phosphoribosyl-AMP cyclohydrolase